MQNNLQILHANNHTKTHEVVYESVTNSVELVRPVNDAADVILKGNTDSRCEWYGKEGLYGQIQTVQGKNLFDGILESGFISGTTGQDTTDPQWVRSKNYIQVQPSTIYTLSSPISYRHIRFYDENKIFLSGANSAYTSLTFTTPTNCRYVRITNASTNLHEQIQLELGSSATIYTPFVPDSPSPNYPSLITPNLPAGIYKKQDYLGDWYEFTLTDDLGGIGTAKDMIAWDKYGRVGWRRNKIGKVDLGSLNWHYISNKRVYAIIADFGAKPTATNNVLANILSPIMKPYNYSYLGNNGDFESLQNGMALGVSLLSIKTDLLDGKTTQAEIKTALSGQFLYFELATPTQTPITFTKNNSSTAPECPMEFITDVPSADYPPTTKKVGVYNSVTGLYDFSVESQGESESDIINFSLSNPLGTGDEYSVDIKTFYPTTTIVACEDSEVKPTIEVTARQFGI